MARNSESADGKRLLDPNGPRLFLEGLCKPFKRMAGTTGLEPAASAVTGQRSNQLNYVPTPEISHIAESRAGCGFAGFACSAPFAALAANSGCFRRNGL